MDTTASTPIRILDTIKAAWAEMKGAKWAIWAALLVMAVIAALLSFVINKITGNDPKNPTFIIQHILLPLLTNLAIAPLYAGAVMSAIKRVRNEEVTGGTSFNYFSKFLPLAITMILMNLIPNILTAIGMSPIITSLGGHGKMIAELLAGVTSLVVYTFLLFSMPLVADKDASPINALKQSIAAVKPHWVKVLLCIVCAYLVMAVPAIPLFIGVLAQSKVLVIVGAAILIAAFIWTAPLFFMIQGKLYQKLVDNG